MSIEPCVADRKKFDLDLKYGKVREKRVADMLQDKKIEVKSERDMWVRTGNIAIEYECYGKPSGITQPNLTTGFTTSVLATRLLQRSCSMSHPSNVS